MAKRKFTPEEARERKNARQREYNKKNNFKSQKEYLKERGRNINFKLFTPQDNDILNFLDSLSNKTGYFKELVRADIEKQKAAGTYKEVV